MFLFIIYGDNTTYLHFTLKSIKNFCALKNISDDNIILQFYSFNTNVSITEFKNVEYFTFKNLKNTYKNLCLSVSFIEYDKLLYNISTCNIDYPQYEDVFVYECGKLASIDVKIISNDYLLIDKVYTRFNLLPNDMRHKIYSDIFNNKVIDINNFKDISVETDNLFIVPSTICTSTNGIIGNSRSLFSHDERFNHTIEQIKSIKKFYPTCTIIMAEGTQISLEYMYKLLCCGVDYIIMFNDDEKGNFFANTHQNRSYYEIYAQYRILTSTFTKLQYDYYFKFGARYILEDKVDNDYSDFNFFGKVISKEFAYDTTEYMVAVIYCFKYICTENYIRILNNMLNGLKISDVEHDLIYNIRNDDFIKFKNIETLNVYGLTGLAGEYKFF